MSCKRISINMLIKILAIFISLLSFTFVIETIELSVIIFSLRKMELNIFWICISIRVDLLNGLIELIFMLVSFLLLYVQVLQNYLIQKKFVLETFQLL